MKYNEIIIKENNIKIKWVLKKVTELERFHVKTKNLK